MISTRFGWPRRVRMPTPPSIPSWRNTDQISQGSQVLDERPRRPADVLRLPRRALDSSSDHEPDRIHVRDSASPTQAYERQWQPNGLSFDGVQARLRCREKMATPQWIGATRKNARRLQVRRWNHARKGRRLIIVRTRVLMGRQKVAI
jgi:hypothetical protein